MASYTSLPARIRILGRGMAGSWHTTPQRFGKPVFGVPRRMDSTAEFGALEPDSPQMFQTRRDIRSAAY
jgi:hypothetical protein